MKAYKRIFLYFIFLLVNVAVFLLFCHRAIKFSFGKVSFEQILFHMNKICNQLDKSNVPFFGI